MCAFFRRSKPVRKAAPHRATPWKPTLERLEDRTTPSLLVSSYGSNSILRYDDSTGAYMGVFASEGLAGPHGMAIGPDGNLYVASQLNHRIMRYDGETGASLGTFASEGLIHPTGITFGPDGNLYVGNFSSDNILRFDGSTGALVGPFVQTGRGGLDGGGNLEFGPDGDLYVQSRWSFQILRYDGTTGAFVERFIPPGTGGLSAPQDFEFNNGKLFVTNTLDTRVPSSTVNSVLQYGATNGASLGTFVSSGSGGLDGSNGLTFGPDGHLYVASTNSDQVLRYNGQTGGFIDPFVSAGSGGLWSPMNLIFTPRQSDIVATSLDWNTAQAGVDFGYRVAGADLTQDTTAALYWASGESFAQRIGAPVYTTTIERPQEDYGPFYVPNAVLGTPPAGATHLLLAVDRPESDPDDGIIQETKENNNVRALALPLADIAMLSAKLQNANTVQFTYETTGNPGPFQVALYQSVDGLTYNSANLIATKTETPNQSGGTATGAFSFSTLPTSPTQPFLLVVADPATPQSATGLVSETIENNNHALIKPGSIDALVSYLQQTFPTADIRVTSGLRTVQEQASLMVEDAVKRLAQGHPEKFLATYGNAAYAEEMVAYLYTPVTLGGLRRWEVIWSNRKQDQDPTREAAITRFAEIIEQARKNGSFVSKHLTGDAVDISVPKTDQATIRRVLALFGAQLNTTEHGNGPHWHITYIV